ncbi:hypothetical protein B566_EDAN001529 [Ephemera danica]|nr:hypothetical protein B566_EDAN001529 [Ephemera danica]
MLDTPQIAPSNIQRSVRIFIFVTLVLTEIQRDFFYCYQFPVVQKVLERYVPDQMKIMLGLRKFDYSDDVTLRIGLSTIFSLMSTVFLTTLQVDTFSAIDDSDDIMFTWYTMAADRRKETIRAELRATTTAGVTEVVAQSLGSHRPEMDAARLFLIFAAVCVSATAQLGHLDEQQLPNYHIEHGRALKKGANSTTVHSVKSGDSRAGQAGVMQLQVEGYFNKYGRDAKGRCCMLPTNSSASVTSCPAECRTFFRVCAARVGPNWPEEPDLRQHTLACPLGLLVTPTLARNSLDPHREGVLLMRFPYKEWPGKLKLTLEAWHDVSGDLFNRGTHEMTRQDYPEENVARLILRVERRHRLVMGDDWMRRSVHLSVPRGETPSSRKPGRRISITYALRLVSPSQSTTTTTTTTPIPEPVHVPLPVISGYNKVNTTSRPRPKPKPTVSSESIVPYPNNNPTPNTIPEPIVQAEQVPLVAYPSKNPTPVTTSAPKPEPEPIVQAEQVPLVAYPSKNPTPVTTSAPKPEPEPVVQAEEVPLVAYPSKHPTSDTSSTSTTTVKTEPLSVHIPLVPYPSNIPISETSAVPQPEPEPTVQSEHVPLVPYPSNNRPTGTKVPQPVVQTEQVPLVPYPSKIPTSTNTPVKTEHVPVVPYPSQNPTPDTKITSTTTSEPEYQYQYVPYPLYGKSNLTADSMKLSTIKPKPDITPVQTNSPASTVITTTESSPIESNPTSGTMVSSNDVTTVVDMTRNLTETTSVETETTEVEVTTQQQTETTTQEEVEVATTVNPMFDDDVEFDEDTWDESDVEPPMIENLSLADLISDILMHDDSTLHISSDTNTTEVSSTPEQPQETVQDLQKPKRRLANVRTKSRLLW